MPFGKMREIISTRRVSDARAHQAAYKQAEQKIKAARDQEKDCLSLAGTNDLKLIAVPSFGAFDCLRSLAVNNHQLTKFPTQVLLLKCLRDLNLNDNKIPTIPAEITNMSKLENLEMESNAIELRDTEVVTDDSFLSPLFGMELFVHINLQKNSIGIKWQEKLKQLGQTYKVTVLLAGCVPDNQSVDNTAGPAHPQHNG